MMLRKQIGAGLSMLILMGAVNSCAPDKENTLPEVCTEMSVSVDCILSSAIQSLEGIADPFVETSAAAELAVAFDSANQKQQAHDLIERALKRALSISDEKLRAKALGEISVALADMKADKNWTAVIDKMIASKAGIENADVQIDIVAKALTARAVHGDTKVALSDIMMLLQETELQENAKAVALRKTAKIMAKKGDFESARNAIDAITMSISYYQAISRTDVAYLAAKADNPILAKELLAEAEPIARGQKNGYFGGGLLRDVAYGYAALSDETVAEKLYNDALAIARTADKQNEKARAVSRIATKQADAGDTRNAKPILQEAENLAQSIDSEMLNGYSYYEIVGSAAISGEFELANAWLEQVPDTPLASTASLKSAALRDIAWGYARYAKPSQALGVANAIPTPREKIHALSRIVRVMNNPQMAALPRYP